MLQFVFVLQTIGVAFAIPEYKASVTVDLTGDNLKSLQRVPSIYWQSCGFTPASDILNPNGTENMWWVGRIPRQGIHYVRIHFLLDLINVTGMKSNTSLIYNWTRLDTAMDILRRNDRYPIFELMGNPNYYFNDWLNETQLYTWRDLVEQVATRYINKYGIDIVLKWLFETWNEVTF